MKLGCKCYERDRYRKSIKYSSPTIWEKPRCKEDLYFCSNEIKGYNIKNNCKIVYIMVSSVTAPNSNSSSKVEKKLTDFTVPENTEEMEVEEESDAYESETDDEDCEANFLPYTKKKKKIHH